MKRCTILFITALSLLMGLSSSEGQTVRGKPNCPFNRQEGGDWKDYITGAYGDRTVGFAVRFDQLKVPIQVPKGAALVPNLCYIVVYEAGTWSIQGETVPDHDLSAPFKDADPAQLLMNMRGKVFKYTRAGQVIDPANNEAVGTMRCKLGSDC